MKYCAKDSLVNNNIIVEVIQVFIHYTRDLRFDDRPDYGFLKRLVKTIAEREKIEFDYNFDWVTKKNEIVFNYKFIFRKNQKM